jgi:hypothetical protein
LSFYLFIYEGLGWISAGRICLVILDVAKEIMHSATNKQDFVSFLHGSLCLIKAIISWYYLDIFFFLNFRQVLYLIDCECYDYECNRWWLSHRYITFLSVIQLALSQFVVIRLYSLIFPHILLAVSLHWS